MIIQTGIDWSSRKTRTYALGADLLGLTLMHMHQGKRKKFYYI
jgi:hypothetical protein